MLLPDLESLRCFEAVAAQLHFRAAASSVSLSPAALSERIRRLEELVGEALFVRTSRRVALTAAGEALLPRARRVLEEARSCLELASKAGARYSIVVGSRFELGLSWLTPSLTALRSAHPERTIHLHFGDSPELLAGVRRGVIDCAVTSVRLAGGDFRYALLHEEQYAFVAAPSVLKRAALRGPRDASQHVLLDLQQDLPLFRYFLDARSPGESWQFNASEYLGTIGAVRHRALEGAGVGVLPRYFIERELAAKALCELLPQVVLQKDYFRLIWRAAHPREEDFRVLAEELRRVPLR